MERHPPGWRSALSSMQLKLAPEQIGLSAVPYQLHFKEQFNGRRT